MRFLGVDGWGTGATLLLLALCPPHFFAGYNRAMQKTALTLSSVNICKNGANSLPEQDIEYMYTIVFLGSKQTSQDPLSC